MKNKISNLSILLCIGVLSLGLSAIFTPQVQAAFGEIENFLRRCSVSIVPASNNTYSLGSTIKPWKTFYGYTVSSSGLTTPLNLDSDADGVADFKFQNDEFSPNATLTKQIGSVNKRFLNGEFYNLGLVNYLMIPNGLEFTGGEKIYQPKDNFIQIDGTILASGLNGAIPVKAGKNTKVSVLPKLALDPLNLLTNGSTNTKVTYIDATPVGEWTGTDADIASSTETSAYKEGTACLGITITDAASAGDVVLNPLASGDENWSDREYVGFWIYSAMSLAAGDMTFRITDSGAGNTDTNIPAITAGQWQWVTLDISGVANASKDVITDIAFVYAVDVGQNQIFIDFLAKWDTTDAFDLSQMPIQDGSLSFITIPGAAASDNAFTSKTEYTHYFVDYINQKVVVITDESANNGLYTYAY